MLVRFRNVSDVALLITATDMGDGVNKPPFISWGTGEQAPLPPSADSAQYDIYERQDGTGGCVIWSTMMADDESVTKGPINEDVPPGNPAYIQIDI